MARKSGAAVVGFGEMRSSCGGKWQLWTVFGYFCGLGTSGFLLSRTRHISTNMICTFTSRLQNAPSMSILAPHNTVNLFNEGLSLENDFLAIGKFVSHGLVTTSQSPRDLFKHRRREARFDYLRTGVGYH